MTGSKSSGGFSIISPDSLAKSKLGHYITEITGYSSESDLFAINKLETVKIRKKLTC